MHVPPIHVIYVTANVVRRHVTVENAWRQEQTAAILHVKEQHVGRHWSTPHSSYWRIING